jgi:probable F420-dependent oxidoreductase
MVALGRYGIWKAGFRFSDEREACAAAATVEELGFTTIWLPDVGGDDLFPRIAALLRATQGLTVATGVMNLWAHDPTAVAKSCTAVQDQYPNRLMLGIGVSHAPYAEKLGGDYSRPLSRVSDYLDALDNAPEPVAAHARMLGALGPRMLAMAGERTAGAHPFLVTPEYTAEARKVLGPDRILAPEVGVVVDQDEARGREIARQRLQGLFALPNYANNLRRLGFGDDDLTPPGSDRLVEALTAWGDEAAASTRLQQHLDAGADHVAIHVLGRPGHPEFPVAEWRRLASVLL